MPREHAGLVSPTESPKNPGKQLEQDGDPEVLKVPLGHKDDPSADPEGHCDPAGHATDDAFVEPEGQ